MDAPARPPLPIQVFLVEDNPDIQENLAGALEELTSARVLGLAATEEDASAWISRHPDGWDVMIVDLFLRGGSGIRLVEKVRRVRDSQKIVVFSNYVNAPVRKRCAQLGVDAVFDKSTEIDALVDYCTQQTAHAASPGSAAAQAPLPGQPSGRWDGSNGHSFTSEGGMRSSMVSAHAPRDTNQKQKNAAV